MGSAGDFVVPKRCSHPASWHQSWAFQTSIYLCFGIPVPSRSQSSKHKANRLYRSGSKNYPLHLALLAAIRWTGRSCQRICDFTAQEMQSLSNPCSQAKYYRGKISCQRWTVVQGYWDGGACSHLLLTNLFPIWIMWWKMSALLPVDWHFAFSDCSSAQAGTKKAFHCSHSMP